MESLTPPRAFEFGGTKLLTGDIIAFTLSVNPEEEVEGAFLYVAEKGAMIVLNPSLVGDMRNTAHFYPDQVLTVKVVRPGKEAINDSKIFTQGQELQIKSSQKLETRGTVIAVYREVLAIWCGALGKISSGAFKHYRPI